MFTLQTLKSAAFTMPITFRATLVLLCASLAAGSGLSQSVSHPIDDTGTYAERIPTMRWRSEQAGERESHAVDGMTRVHVVLQTQAWRDRQAKIFMVMPPQAVPSLQVRWSARGPLRSAQLQGGQRVLVFEGTVPAAALRDVLDLRVSADGRELASTQRLDFAFEIEPQ